jgi:hypothetical protein
MASLKDTESGAEHPVEGRSVLIGRGEDCDIVLASRLVSRHHARIHKALLGGYTIEDAGSTHGTYVNDERVKKARRLQTGDTIILAKAPLRRGTPKPPSSDDPHATSEGYGMHGRPARGELVRGDIRIGAEFLFRA